MTTDRPTRDCVSCGAPVPADRSVCPSCAALQPSQAAAAGPGPAAAAPGPARAAAPVALPTVAVVGPARPRGSARNVAAVAAVVLAVVAVIAGLVAFGISRSHREADVEVTTPTTVSTTADGSGRSTTTALVSTTIAPTDWSETFDSASRIIFDTPGLADANDGSNTALPKFSPSGPPAVRSVAYQAADGPLSAWVEIWDPSGHATTAQIQPTFAAVLRQHMVDVSTKRPDVTIAGQRAPVIAFTGLETLHSYLAATVVRGSFVLAELTRSDGRPPTDAEFARFIRSFRAA